MQNNQLCTLLRDAGIRPVLMDIGASGAPPHIWNDIAPESIYIGFDPDLREIHEDTSSQFFRSVIVNEAVTAERDAHEVNFYLTKSPFCSTTLPPNPQETVHWLEQDGFQVQTQARVRATTIDEVLRRLDIQRLDWIKLDSQGIDLRLLNSISSDVLSRVMAVDTEPGLISCYQREDMFGEVHCDLTANGFWLSAMNVGGFVRMRKSTLEAARRENSDVDDRYVRAAVRRTPTYLEVRYLRTLEWLAQRSHSQEDYILLWIFALTDQQLGFAMDVSEEFARVFGVTDISQKLKATTVSTLQRAHRRDAVYKTIAPVRGRLRGAISRLLP